MKIYTRTGDGGETALFGGPRVPKDHTRVEAYGEVDETNAFIGAAVSELHARGEGEMAARLRLVQADLFAIGAHLSTAPGRQAAASHLPPLPARRVPEMESWMDEAERDLEPLTSFILPGGSEAASRLHVARTTCRRAERRVISLMGAEPVNVEIVRYLNRLSDLLFVMARLANRRTGVEDSRWEPESPRAGIARQGPAPSDTTNITEE